MNETPEQREKRLARKRELGRKASNLRKMGKPQRVLPHEFERAQRILRKAKASGMTDEQIARQTGNVRSCIWNILSGRSKSMQRDTYNRILALRPEVPVGTNDTRRGGARMSPVGTTRRLRALTAIGWTARAMEPHLNFDRRNLSEIITGKVAFVFAVTQREIADAYDKLQYMDPTEHGVTEEYVNRAKINARRKGWAPTWAWDEDTIDDPDAFPEWTGACGTDEGYAIHVREKIEICQPCRAAMGPDRSYDGRLSGELLRERMEAAGFDHKKLAAELGVDPDAVRRWVNNQRQPRLPALKGLAHALGCKPEDLMVGRAEMENMIFEDDFNRGKFEEVVQSTWPGTMSGLASAVGVSRTAIGKWRRGEVTPQISSIRKTAEVLGVDWREFYNR